MNQDGSSGLSDASDCGGSSTSRRIVAIIEPVRNGETPLAIS
jgi:hypothetical protein